VAAVKTQRDGQIVRAPSSEAPSLVTFMQKHEGDFSRVLPKHMSPERMVRLAISAVRTTRNLSECSLPSFASAIMACSTLGLEPNTPLGHAYLIPFRNKGRYECSLIVGYKGLLELMYRSGIVASVKCTPVFEGDEFNYQFGLHPDIVHRPGPDGTRWNPEKLTYVYPVIRLREAGMDPIWDVLDRGQIEQRRRRSRTSQAGPWVTDYVAMALKTGIRSIATWVPSSAERTLPLAQAVAYEEATERGRRSDAVAALGDAAQDTMQAIGAFPMPEDDDEPEVSSNSVDVESTREPGED
jgi:recombination protein RecT